MLDDLKMIHERDSKDVLGMAGKLWQQLQHQFVIENSVDYQAQDIQQVVYAGVDSAALAAEVSTRWPGYSVPFEICRDYQAPRYVSDHTLFIAADYSGDSEEVLSSLRQADSGRANIVVITSGGVLLDIARQKAYPLIVLPSGLQEGQAMLYMLKALYSVAEATGLSGGPTGEVSDCADWLHRMQASWSPNVATGQNWAKQIAQELAGKSVVVYSGPLMHPAAYAWKSSINKYAKQLAWCGQYSEFNHNEVLGWTKQPVTKPYAIVDIRSNLEHPLIQKSFEVSERLLSGLRPSPVVIQPQGDSVLAQLLYAYLLGEYVAVYLALLAGNDPSSADILNKFKKELA